MIRVRSPDHYAGCLRRGLHCGQSGHAGDSVSVLQSLLSGRTGRVVGCAARPARVPLRSIERATSLPQSGRSRSAGHRRLRASRFHRLALIELCGLQLRMPSIDRVHNVQQHVAKQSRYDGTVGLVFCSRTIIAHRAQRSIEPSADVDHEVANAAGNILALEHYRLPSAPGQTGARVAMRQHAGTRYLSGVPPALR